MKQSSCYYYLNTQNLKTVENLTKFSLLGLMILNDVKYLLKQHAVPVTGFDRLGFVETYLSRLDIVLWTEKLEIADKFGLVVTYLSRLKMVLWTEKLDVADRTSSMEV